MEDSSSHSTDPQQGFQAPGTGMGGLLSVVGSLPLGCKVSFRKLSGAWGPTGLEGCKIPVPLPNVSLISFLYEKKKSKKPKSKRFVCISIQYISIKIN